jgi:hypothetical protein
MHARRDGARVRDERPMLKEILIVLIVVNALAWVWTVWQIRKRELLIRRMAREQFDVLAERALTHPACDAYLRRQVAERRAELESRRYAWLLGLTLGRRLINRMRRAAGLSEWGFGAGRRLTGGYTMYEPEYPEALNTIMARLDYAMFVHATTLIPGVGLVTRAMLAELIWPGERQRLLQGLAVLDRLDTTPEPDARAPTPAASDAGQSNTST